MDVVHFFKDEDGDWRWNRVSENGNIVADSGEGYKNHSDCKNMAVEINGPDVEYVNDESES